MKIELRGVEKRYDDHTVLNGINLSLEQGEVVVLEGQNGAGKTTLIEVLAGLVEPDAGELLIDGRPLDGLQPSHRGLFYVPQNVHKFWSLKEDNLACYLPRINVRDNLLRAAREDEDKVEDFLYRFGLYQVRKTLPGHLSRGQKQRLALARAFLCGAQILLLDEPLASLDPGGRQDLVEHLSYLQRRYQRTMIYVTQHPAELADLGGRTLRLQGGDLVAIHQNPIIKAAGWLHARALARGGKTGAIARGASTVQATLKGLRHLANEGNLRDEIEDLKNQLAERITQPKASSSVTDPIPTRDAIPPSHVSEGNPNESNTRRRRRVAWVTTPHPDNIWKPGRLPKQPAHHHKHKKTWLGRRIMILRCPSLMYNYHGIPPFGLATITAQLQKHGAEIWQDDLDAKCAADELFPRHRWGKQYPAKDLMMDIGRMRRYWEGGEDLDVVSLVECVLDYTDLSGVDTVALSCIEGDDYAAVLTLCLGKYVREVLGKTVVVGGEAFPHMQPIKSELKYFLDTGCLDYYIQGYGEVPLVELFKRLDAGADVSPTPGLVSLNADGTIRENRPLFTRPEVVPEFSGLPMHLYYKFPDEWGGWTEEDEGVDEILILPLKLNFCCPNKCAFCISSGDEFTKVTHLSPENIVHAIRSLKEKHGSSYFMFADDMFNTSAAWAESVADALIEADLNVLWSDCAFGRDIDLPLLKKLRKAGAIRLVWGMETGSKKLQKVINKRLDLDYLSDVLRWSHEAGIYNALQVIAGLPGETDEDIDQTIEFLRKNQPYIDQVYLNPFSLINGSLMEKYPKNYGIKNIKPVATIFQATPDKVYSWIQRYTFDTEWLDWEDKVKQIEQSFKRLQRAQLDLDLGGHDIHTLMQRFSKYGEKHLVQDFQSNRRHQGFDYFGQRGEGHSPAAGVPGAPDTE